MLKRLLRVKAKQITSDLFDEHMLRPTGTQHKLHSMVDTIFVKLLMPAVVLCIEKTSEVGQRVLRKNDGALELCEAGAAQVAEVQKNRWPPPGTGPDQSVSAAPRLY